MLIASGTSIDNRFSILRQVGAGGMGAVYQAEQKRLGRTVALKFLDLSNLQDKAESLCRMEQEAQVLSRLHHRHIVTVYGFHSDPQFGPFIVMEYVAGVSLHA